VPNLLYRSTPTPCDRPATNGWSDANSVNAVTALTVTQLLTMHARMVVAVA